MKLQTFLLLLLCQSLLLETTGQSNYLESSDEMLIGPADVSWPIKEQFNYYTSRYEGLIDTLDLFEEEYLEEILQIEGKRKKRARDKKNIKTIEEYIEELRIEKEKINYTLNLWKKIEVPVSSMILKKIDSDTACYDLLIGRDYYTSDEYAIVETVLGDSVHWYEVLEVDNVKETETIITQPASTKWVKKKADRNCLSADPNDCLVWCLVEVPAQSRTVSRLIGGECPEAFVFDDEERNCVKKVSYAINENSPIGTKRLVELSTRKVLNLEGVRLLKCE